MMNLLGCEDKSILLPVSLEHTIENQLFFVLSNIPLFAYSNWMLDKGNYDIEQF